MVKSLFISSIPFDAATVNASNEIPSLPARFLQTMDPEQKWRASVYNPTLVIQLAEARACNRVVIIGHNGNENATVRFRGGNSEAAVTGGSPTFDSGVVSMWKLSGKPSGDELQTYTHLSSLVSVVNDTDLEWYSLTFGVSGGDPPSTFEAGRVMIDRGVEPENGPANTINLQVVTTDEQRRGSFNRLRTDVRGPNARRMQVPFLSINKEDFRKKMFNFQMRHGRGVDFFFSANPEADEDFLLYSMQALFEDPAQFDRQLQFDADGAVWRTVISLLEQT